MNEKPEKVAEHRYIVLSGDVPFGKANNMVGVGEMIQELAKNTNDEIRVESIH